MKAFVCCGPECGVLYCLWAAFVQLFPFLFAMSVSLQRLSATREACRFSASVVVHTKRFAHLKCATGVRSDVCTGICKMSVVCLDYFSWLLQLFSLTNIMRAGKTSGRSEMQKRCHF